MNFMTNNLRNYQARSLYENFDQWLYQRLQTKSVTVDYAATGPVEVWYNDVLIASGSTGRITVDHVEPNCVQIDARGHSVTQFKIDNFDCTILLQFDKDKAKFNFGLPFAIWYNRQVARVQNGQVLLDSILYKEQCDQLEQQILQQLQKIKF